jgi:hypothetical protein
MVHPTMCSDNVPTLSLPQARTVSAQRTGSKELHHIEEVAPLMFAQQIHSKPTCSIIKACVKNTLQASGLARAQCW